MTPERITLSGLPAYSGLNETSALNYFKAKYSMIPLIKNRIINPFEELLEKETGFSSENQPHELTITKRTYGDITFTVESETRKKRPQLMEVYQEITQYLNFLEENYQKGIQRKGVKTFENNGYVLLDDLISQLDELRKEVTLKEVKHTIHIDLSEEYNKSPVIIPISYKLALNTSGAQLYLRAESLEQKLEKEVVKPFENCLKEQTGYNKENVPEQSEVKWVQVGAHLFEINSIPESTVKYADIIDGLVKLAPARITARTKIGDLVKIKAGLSDSMVEAAYSPRVDEGKTYVWIRGMLQRLQNLKEQSTHKTLNQPIRYYPVV